jgi:3',5'-cyclic AMP phosphodiesterase CpdA
MTDRIRPSEPVLTRSTRRGLLKGAAALGLLGAGGLAATGCQTGRRSSGDGPNMAVNPARRVRLIHFTDAHIRPEFDAVRGVATGLAHACSTTGDADAIVTGGDMIMFSMDQTEATTAGLWDLWNATWAARCPMPAMHCIGNHDIWGWNRRRSETTGDEPLWGKKWWLKTHGLERTYSAHNLGAWRVIVLDSVYPLGDSYQGLLDEEQFAWLEGELAGAAGRHVLVISHIPILSAGMLDCDARRGEAIARDLGVDVGPSPASSRARGLVIGAGAMHMDAHRLLRLFQRAGNVRACLSGHIHIVDAIRYAGIDFFCSGAVSGSWWRGIEANRARMRERNRAGDIEPELRPERARPGYAVVDLHADGRVSHEHREFGWTYAVP